MLVIHTCLNSLNFSKWHLKKVAVTSYLAEGEQFPYLSQYRVIPDSQFWRSFFHLWWRVSLCVPENLRQLGPA